MKSLLGTGNPVHFPFGIGLNTRFFAHFLSSESRFESSFCIKWKVDHYFLHGAKITTRFAKQTQYLFRFRQKKVCSAVFLFALQKLFGSFFLISLRIESFLGIGIGLILKPYRQRLLCGQSGLSSHNRCPRYYQFTGLKTINKNPLAIAHYDL